MNHPSSREEALFSAALELAPAARAAFLARECGADPALPARVAALLESHEAVHSFMETPADLATFRPKPATPDAELDTADLARTEIETDRQIGRYKLLQKIGEGGCGIVY